MVVSSCMCVITYSPKYIPTDKFIGKWIYTHAHNLWELLYTYTHEIYMYRDKICVYVYMYICIYMLDMMQKLATTNVNVVLSFHFYKSEE